MGGGAGQPFAVKLLARSICCLWRHKQCSEAVRRGAACRLLGRRESRHSAQGAPQRKSPRRSSEVNGEIFSTGVRANRVTFNELLRARVLEQDMDGAWRVANLVVNAVTCHPVVVSERRTHPEATSNVSSTSCWRRRLMRPCFHVFETCNRLEHVEPLPHVLNRLPCRSSNVSAPAFGDVIKSSGHLVDVDRVRELWKEMNARCLQPGPATFACMAEALVINGMW